MPKRRTGVPVPSSPRSVAVPGLPALRTMNVVVEPLTTDTPVVSIRSSWPGTAASKRVFSSPRVVAVERSTG